MSARTAWGHLALTLLQQGHLCPLPLLAAPIWWHHDGGLSLYPLPHALLLADASPAQEYAHMGCKVVNPVSGSVWGTACSRGRGRGREREQLHGCTRSMCALD